MHTVYDSSLMSYITYLVNSLTSVYQMAIDFECILLECILVILSLDPMSRIIDLIFDLLMNLLPITFESECIDDVTYIL